MIGTLPLGHAGVLDLVGYPTWQLIRPQAWTCMPDVVASLRALLASTGRPA
jgi:hypothetical protein